MIPRLGRHRAKHFAHRPPEVCAEETYLHRLAKLTFFEAYRSCLEHRRPFYLLREIRTECDHYVEQLGFTCPISTTERHDLTRYFDQATLEAEHGGYRADVLLSSSTGGEVLFVEVAVTHPCESEKRASGIRIVEFLVGDEEEARGLAAEVIVAGPRVHLYNFRQQSSTGSFCQGECDERVSAFLVYPSRKSVLVEVTPCDLLGSLWKRRTNHKELIGRRSEHEPATMYRRKVREAHFSGVQISNCFLCRYHGGDGIENAVFCKLRKESVGSNEAVECGHYRPLPSWEACEEVDRRNEAYVQQNLGRMLGRGIRRGLF